MIETINSILNTIKGKKNLIGDSTKTKKTGLICSYYHHEIHQKNNSKGEESRWKKKWH